MKLREFLLLSLIIVISFTSCSDNDINDIVEETEYVLSELRFLKVDRENGVGEVPFGWGESSWKYGESGLLEGFSSRISPYVPYFSDIEISDTYVKASGRYESPSSRLIELAGQNVFFIDNKISEVDILLSTIETNPENIYTYHNKYIFHYDGDGYLVQITRTSAFSREEIKIERENGNISKVITNDATYQYTYDNQDYIPMSDFCPYTPVFMYCPYPFVEFYKKMGNPNKNNISKVEILYSRTISQSNMRSVTYTPEFDIDGKLKWILHSGTYYPHFSEGNEERSFSGAKTYFIYK